MAEQRPICVYDGLMERLHAGDTLPIDAIPDAGATNRGVMNVGLQTFAGPKAFYHQVLVYRRPGDAQEIFVIIDDTPASAGVPTESPWLDFIGNAWDTVALVAVQRRWALKMVPTDGHPVPARLSFCSDGTTGALHEVASIDDTGTITADAFVGDGSGLTGITTGPVPWSSVTATPTTLAGYGIGDAQPLDTALTAISAGTWAGAGSITTVGTLAAGAVPWSLLTGTPSTLAGYGITSPLGLAVGGTAADLSGTGPGALVQATAGAAVTVVPRIGEELDYAAVTAGGTMTGTTFNTRTTLFSANPLTFAGTERIKVEVYIPLIVCNAQVANIYLTNGTTAFRIGSTGNTTTIDDACFYAVVYLNPAAATITYAVQAFSSGGGATWSAGAQGSNQIANAYIRISRA